MFLVEFYKRDLYNRGKGLQRARLFLGGKALRVSRVHRIG
jgi:hypothetical protein